ncbi:SMP-30/gluconolactonase/LRE family protein [Glycomyces harbinensis]|uniref:Sugar lactone lactonase YvrE n=1 Tax=Glycomyces harbinensis TaxID=58114 RepID=A0A1G6ZLA9_9ACTN|nr:SMP-30/gluconolactonase/LRE family protein [Glycomyces harbinensis]SDE02356.1 Sugar lactone lactonase YvrE [Glycomyces harbinensis]
MHKHITGPVLAALAAATLVAAASPATAAGPQGERRPDLVEAQAPTLYPEGVAYDSGRDAFLVSSARHGTVSIVADDGTVETLVEDPAMIAALGVTVDARNDRLLVANADNGVAEGSSSETAGLVAGLGIFDLESGDRIAYIDLAALVPDGGGFFANDVAVAPDGTAYVTDSFAGAVYAVEPDGSASMLVRDERLAFEGGYGANGIVYDSGRLVVGNYSDASLWRIDTARPDRLREVKVDGDLTGVDGLRLRPDGSLVAVLNTLGGGGEDAVRVLWLSRDWGSATVKSGKDWPDAAPTAATVVGCSVHVLSGDLGLLLSGTGSSDEFSIRRY